MTLTDLLDELGIDYRLAGDDHHVSAGWVGIPCRRCSPDKFKCGVNEASLACHCWTCGRLYLKEALAEASGRRYGEVQTLLDRLRLRLRPPEGIRRATGRLEIPKGVGPLLGAHERYLRGRRFSPERLVSLWGIGGIGPAPRLQWRVFIPVTLGGKTVSWTTRHIADREPKYHSARPSEEAVPHKEVLYGADRCGHACVVVEGPADVWRVGPGAVGTFGTSVSRAQVARIARFPTRAICFDSEPVAQRLADGLCSLLGSLPGRTVRVELDAADPGSAGHDEVKKLREEFLS